MSNNDTSDLNACLSLEGTSVCTPWTTGNVNVSAGWTVSMFDTSLAVWGDSPAHTQLFNQVYQCNWDGRGLRYVLTYGCAERLFSSDASCNTNKPLTRMCKSSCQSYLQSLSTVMDNCQSLELKNETLSFITTFCSQMDSTDKCIDSVKAESICGFANLNDAYNYCSRSSDQCCRNLPQSSGLSTTAIAIVSTLNSLVFIGIIAAWWAYSRKTTANKPIEHVAIHDYHKRLSDEVMISKGDRILIRKIYDDGWVMGRNQNTGKSGTFPAGCIQPIENP